MSNLEEDEIEEALARLESWTREGDSIIRELSFPSFRDAVAFVVRLSYEAEAADHHPDIDIRYDKVRVALTTHSVGGLTPKDFALARAIQGLAP